MKVPKTPPGIKMDIVINENPNNKYSFFAAESKIADTGSLIDNIID